MGGRQADQLAELRSDLQALDEPGFWAISGTFEGNWTLARFKEVRERPFLPTGLDLKLGDWNTSKSQDEYENYVEHIRAEIARGEVYQVNACRVLSASLQTQNQLPKSTEQLSYLFHRILNANPAPFAGYLSLPHLEIASASPERFLSKIGRRITSSPIKGTSATDQFLEKDRAENLMIVDLIRNDLGQISKIGSVSTPRLLATEAHPGLYHLVSDVTAELAQDVKVSEILTQICPPGSVSGAPKSSALRIIRSNEGIRGPYCGVFGWSDGKQMQLSVAIRIFWREDDYLKFGTGAGITWDSVPSAEWEETELKARRLISLTGP